MAALLFCDASLCGCCAWTFLDGSARAVTLHSIQPNLKGHSATTALKRQDTPKGMGCVAPKPTCGPPLILSPPLKRWGPPDGRGYEVTKPTCGRILILSPARKHWGPPNGKGYVAIRPRCGPILIMSTILKCWRSPHGRRYVATTPMWDTYDFVPRSKVLVSP